MRLFGWLQIKVGKIYKKKVSRFVKLNGEVLSIHTAEHSLPSDEVNIYGALVDFSSSPNRRDFRVVIGKKSLHITCNSREEMTTWAESMQLSAKRSFFDAYNLGARLAEGSYSRVYLCHDAVNTGEEFVVKVVSRKHGDFEALKWLERERHINTVVAHRCVVRAVDMFASRDDVHIVFEHMRGGTVRDLLNNHRRLGESYARVIMRELLLALHYLHSKNIVHRDVRPDNLFCSHKKFPMAIALGDFGYANFFSDKVVNQDVLTTFIGTPPYTAAEICRREKYGPSVDLWSAGVTLYEILCGNTPFDGRTDRDAIVKGRVSFAEPEWKKISPNAKKLIRQLLQPDPHKRISALAALQHAWFGSNGAPLQTTPSAQRLITPSESGRQLMPSGSSRSLSARNDELDQLATSGDAKVISDSSETESDRDEGDRPRGGLERNALSLRAGRHGMSRVGSSASSGVSQGAFHKRQSAPATGGKLTSVGSQPTLQYSSSVSSLSGLSTGMPQSRMAMTPSMQRIQEVGLERAAKENPARMKAFLKSPVVKSQLSSMFTMRRRLIVASRAFVAVFRMRALVRGQSLTRNLSRVGSVKAVDVKVGDQRKEQAEKVSQMARSASNRERKVASKLEAITKTSEKKTLATTTTTSGGEKKTAKSSTNNADKKATNKQNGFERKRTGRGRNVNKV